MGPNRQDADEDREQGLPPPSGRSRYSTRNVCMMHLLGLDDNGEEESNKENTDWRRLTGYQGLGEGDANQNGEAGGRKTCLSTELDLNVFYEMMLGDGDD